MVGGTDYSNYVQQADLWRESLTGIGRWEVVLDPYPNFWGGMFAVDQNIRIFIDGVLMMEGYIDDIKPFLADTGTFTVLYRLSGRDYGIDLALLYISALYRNTRADDIVQAALIAAGSEIRFASPSIAGFIDYEFDRTFLSDGIQDIAQRVGYDFYVNNTMAFGIVAMNFFPVGDPVQHTAVDLVCDANSLTNNILGFDLGESIGFNIVNRVEAVAGPLKDHWTDMNEADWGAGGTGTTITAENTIFLEPQNAIRCTGDGLSNIRMELTFPRYDHTTVDMSDEGHIRYLTYQHNTDAGVPGMGANVSVELRDTNNNIIGFYRRAAVPLNDQKYTADLADDRWYEIRPHCGTDVRVGVGLGAVEYWYWVANVTGTFDWANVDMIAFTSYQNSPAGSWFIIDGLTIDQVEVRSIATDPAPIGGTRMLPIYRNDITSQVELDAFAAWELARTQDPLENILITAIGQTGTPYAGQSLDVRIAGYIPALTMYRIFELHHQVVKSSAESLEPGYTFITEYNLIRHNLTAGGTQVITPEKALFPVSPIKSDIRKKRRQLYALDRQNLP